MQDVNRDQTDKNAFQEFDHLGLFTSCTKWVRRVTEASRVEDYVDQAIAIACSGRPGPVALMLPADLLNEAAAASQRHASLGHFRWTAAWPQQYQVRRSRPAGRRAAARGHRRRRRYFASPRKRANSALLKRRTCPWAPR